MHVEKKTNWEGKGAAELNEQGFAFAHPIFRPGFAEEALSPKPRVLPPNMLVDLAESWGNLFCG